MNRLQKIVLTSVLAAIMVGTGSPTAHAERKMQAGANFIVGFPQGDFKDNLDKNEYGGEGQFLFAPQSSIFGIGLSASYAIYGTEKRREPFSTTIPDVTVDVTTTNNVGNLHLLFRIQPQKGDIRPYVDGLAGLSYLFTETKISNASNGEEVASSKNFDDAIFSYGGGAGTLVRIYKSGENDRPLEAFLNIGVRYLFGDEAEYLKPGSIARNGGVVTYDISKSKVNVATLLIGAMFNF